MPARVDRQIIDWLAAQDRPQGISAIARGAGVSRPSVRKYLAILDGLGVLNRTPGPLGGVKGYGYTLRRPETPAS